MECYVCGTPRPEGANYCPGCGRYCADDPNVRKVPSIPMEEISIEEPIPVEVPVTPDESIPMEEPVPETEPPLEQNDDQPPVSEEPVSVQTPPSETPAPVETPQKRNKKHRPVLIPLVSMILLFAVGTFFWFLMPYTKAPMTGPTQATEPGINKDYKPPLPQQKGDDSDSNGASSREFYTPTDEDCFRIENGAVRFLPERYDGNPILVIPAEIDGQTVTAIADRGFMELEGVTTIILPDTLETIGESAFANCKKLRGVFIPDSVKSIGKSAFDHCIDMESVSIPVGTTSIGADAFDGCASLMYIFYEGSYEDWMALYNEYITPFTYACCADGEYYHGAYTP